MEDTWIAASFVMAQYGWFGLKIYFDVLSSTTTEQISLLFFMKVCLRILLAVVRRARTRS